MRRRSFLSVAISQRDVLHVASITGEVLRLGKPDHGSAAPGSQWTPVRDELFVESAVGVNVFNAESGWRRATHKIGGPSLPVAFHPNGQDIV
jgi:hypothetical protein